MPLIDLVSSDIKQAIERFDQFHQRFAQYFATKTRTVAHRAKQCLQGQLQYQRWGNVGSAMAVVPKVIWRHNIFVSKHCPLTRFLKLAYENQKIHARRVVRSSHDLHISRHKPVRSRVGCSGSASGSDP